MALIKNIAEFNEHVTVASDFDEDKLLKYAKRAERNIIKLIGKTAFEEIEEDSEEEYLLKDYVANMGLSMALPALVINITSYGTFTNKTSDSNQAEWWQIKDLNRSLLKFAFTSLDDALEIIGIENNQNLSDLFVTNVQQFNHVFSINESAQTFLSMVPFIREVQDQFLRATLGDCYDYANFTDAQKKLIRAAIVNLALAKAAVSGSFSIESNVFLLRIEVMPWEKVEKVEQSSLERFKEDRYNVGMGYLNQVLKFVKELPCYEARAYTNKIECKKSGLYL